MLVSVDSFVTHQTPPGAAARLHAFTSWRSARLEMSGRTEKRSARGAARRTRDGERGECEADGGRLHAQRAAIGEGRGAPRMLAMKSRYQ